MLQLRYPRNIYVWKRAQIFDVCWIARNKSKKLVTLRLLQKFCSDKKKKNKIKTVAKKNVHIYIYIYVYFIHIYIYKVVYATCTQVWTRRNSWTTFPINLPSGTGYSVFCKAQVECVLSRTMHNGWIRFSRYPMEQLISRFSMKLTRG